MNKTIFVSFVILITLALSLRLYFFYSTKPVYKNGQGVEIVARIASEPVITAKIQKFTVKLPNVGKVSVITTKYPQYYFNQQISIIGNLQIKENKDSTYLSLYFPAIKLVGEEKNPLFVITSFIRKKAIELFDSVLPPAYSSLLLGVVFGIKTDMPQDFYTALQSAGVMHVIAASGMNVTMLAGALIYIFSSFFRRRTALILSIFGIIFYTILAGIEPSIVRAAIMGSIAFSAGIFGKKNLPFYILFLTAALMLFIDPNLLTDVGFQLSFLATAGIMLLQPLFVFLQKGRIGRVAGEDLITTLSAQIATAPVLLSNFGSINLLSVVVNLLVLWTVPPLMAIGSISVLFGLLFKPIGQIILYLAYPLLWFFELVVIWFGSIMIPLKMDNVPLALSIGYYFIVLAVALGYRLKIKDQKSNIKYQKYR